MTMLDQSSDMYNPTHFTSTPFQVVVPEPPLKLLIRPDIMIHHERIAGHPDECRFRYPIDERLMITTGRPPRDAVILIHGCLDPVEPILWYDGVIVEDSDATRAQILRQIQTEIPHLADVRDVFVVRNAVEIGVLDRRLIVVTDEDDVMYLRSDSVDTVVEIFTAHRGNYSGSHAGYATVTPDV
jgi:hypothetical protein